MCYRKKISQKAISAFVCGLMFAAGGALAADEKAAIDLGIDDEFGFSVDDLEKSDSPKINIDKDKKGGLVVPAPKTGVQPIVPKTGNAPIVPKTGVQPIVPKTGNAPIVPKTGVQPIVPKTGNAPIVPKTGVQPIVPKTGNAPIVPKTGVQPIVPKTGNAPIVPKTGAQPIVPKTGTPATPAGEESKDAPTPLLVKKGAALNIFDEIDDEVFSQMSDIEKQTAILSLELRREKIKNEIEAVKAQREKAESELRMKEEEQKLKRQEWEKEQEKKIIEEQIKLKKAGIAYEKLRQEELLSNYKEYMLKEQQKWIENNASIYEKVENEKKERKEFTASVKEKLSGIVASLTQASVQAERVIEKHKREISELQTQISILKARLEAEPKTNPFADAQKEGEKAEDKEEEVVENTNISDLYIIMQITGHEDKLVAKLMNKDGQTFLVQNGTVLQTGQKVDEITSTYVRVDRDGVKEYLYFAAGGILDKEPSNGVLKAIEAREKEKNSQDKDDEKKKTTRAGVTSRGVPGISRDMIMR